MSDAAKSIRPQTLDEAWRNYRQNRGWFVLRARPVPKSLRLSEAEFRRKYGREFEQDKR